MSIKEPPTAVEGYFSTGDVVVEMLEPETLSWTTVLPAGSGKTEMFLRILLTTNFDDVVEHTESGAKWVDAIRNALVHEVRLYDLIRRASPGLQVDTFLELLAGVLTAEAKSATPLAHFTEAELDELEREGLSTIDAVKPHSAQNRGAAEFAALIMESLSVGEVADLLGVDSSRIRQRLNNRTLYGIRSGRYWRLPRFQFTEHGLVPGLDQVLTSLPASLHPVAVQRWLTTPTPDLDLDGETLAPLQWLMSSGRAGPVVEIARDL